jgi:CRISPR-associated protein Cmr2
MVNQIYTAISFAPVQGFIEKSRKLRDLYGASQILSYLSQQIVLDLHNSPEVEVISPALLNVQKGMPNKILVRGLVDRNRVKNILLKHWQHLLEVCRKWVEERVEADYHWSQKPDQVGKVKGEWERWGSYAWEIFWGKGSDPQAAMKDLETRKLKRDWTSINWVGESSSLSGTDAIAWPRLGDSELITRTLKGEITSEEKLQLCEEQELFYRRLSWLLDDPDRRVGRPHLSWEQLREYEKSNADGIGRYIAVNERLSIPELVKRLITYDKIDEDRPEEEKLKIAKLRQKPEDPEFKDIYREAGYWTGWFMGDGDRIGDKLQRLAERHPNDEVKRDRDLTSFSDLMRNWGEKFETQRDLFPEGRGRVIYAGGDDFLGVLYSEESDNFKEKPEKVKPIEAWNWLRTLPEQWKELQNALKEKLEIDMTYSVGFVWAGHQVPQRDILQHCREAEKLAKSLGCDRVTIRVVFNSGQYVQWTCPWDYLDILTKYRDRDGINTEEETKENSKRTANWNHIYNDWATLKSRHSIRLQEMEKMQVNKLIPLSLFNLYFDDAGKIFEEERLWDKLTGDNTDQAIVNWINDLIQVGWQLCRNSEV